FCPLPSPHHWDLELGIWDFTSHQQPPQKAPPSVPCSPNRQSAIGNRQSDFGELSRTAIRKCVPSCPLLSPVAPSALILHSAFCILHFPTIPPHAQAIHTP